MARIAAGLETESMNRLPLDKNHRYSIKSNGIDEIAGEIQSTGMTPF